MAEPVTIITGLLTGVAGFVSAVGRLTENPIMAYFLVLSVLIADAGTFSLIGGQGVIGTLLTVIVNNLGIGITIYSWELLVLFGILPVVVWIWNASASR